MARVTLSFPDKFLEELDRFKDARYMKRNGVLMLGFYSLCSHAPGETLPTAQIPGVHTKEGADDGQVELDDGYVETRVTDYSDPAEPRDD